MEIIEAIVEAGGVVRLEGLPFETGSRLEVTLAPKNSILSTAEWRQHIERHFGTLSSTSFEAPLDSTPQDIEPLR